MCRISVRIFYVFTSEVGSLDFWVFFLKKVFQNWKIGYIGSHGAPWGPIQPISPILENNFSEKVHINPKCHSLGWKHKRFPLKFCTFWCVYRLVGTFIWLFRGLLGFSQNWSNDPGSMILDPWIHGSMNSKLGVRAGRFFLKIFFRILT